MKNRVPRPRLTDVQTLIVPAVELARTCALMRAHGECGDEALVLWLGNVDAGAATVVHAMAPPQEGVRSEDGVGYFVSGETMFELNRLLSETGLRLIAQVHSHPHDAYHSAADDRLAVVTTDGGFSLVAPDFGAGEPFGRWAMYRLASGRWCEVSPAEMFRMLRVVGR
jgi:hypothetical protein